MDFVLSSREFDLLISSLGCSFVDNISFGDDELAWEYNKLRGRFEALQFQIKEDAPINVLYPNVYEKLRCGDNSSRP